jgi:3-oxoacyl-[acyl-carrier-protein] synthase-3
MGLRIVSAAIAVPPTVETAADLAKKVSKSASWIERHTGVIRRHVADPDLQLPSLAAEAARLALTDDDPPDLILNASASQHQLLPDTSVFVQQELGLTGIASYSIHAACMSFLMSLQVADALLAAGAYRRILICSAELASRSRNYRDPETAALLGDGAAAAVVQRDDSSAGLRQFAMRVSSEDAELSGVRSGGLGRHPLDPNTRPEDYLFHMQGREVYRSTRPRLIQMVDEVLGNANLTLQDIDLVIPHQASGPGLKLLERLGFAPQRIVNIIADYGNCVAASIPMALAVAMQQSRLKPGDRVLFVGAAAGLSVGVALLEW